MLQRGKFLTVGGCGKFVGDPFDPFDQVGGGCYVADAGHAGLPPGKRATQRNATRHYLAHMVINYVSDNYGAYLREDGWTASDSNTPELFMIIYGNYDTYANCHMFIYNQL